MNWVLKYAAICIATIAVLLGAAWIFVDVDLHGLGTQGVVAMAVGVVFTVAVAVGLMALTFLHGHDERTGNRRATDLPKQGRSP
jgi:ABC-type nickel/cobalt efflux system permease component RcnA